MVTEFVEVSQSGRFSMTELCIGDTMYSDTSDHDAHTTQCSRCSEIHAIAAANTSRNTHGTMWLCKTLVDGVFSTTPTKHSGSHVNANVSDHWVTSDCRR